MIGAALRQGGSLSDGFYVRPNGTTLCKKTGRAASVFNVSHDPEGPRLTCCYFAVWRRLSGSKPATPSINMSNHHGVTGICLGSSRRQDEQRHSGRIVHQV